MPRSNPGPLTHRLLRFCCWYLTAKSYLTAWAVGGVSHSPKNACSPPQFAHGMSALAVTLVVLPSLESLLENNPSGVAVWRINMFVRLPKTSREQDEQKSRAGKS